MARKMKRWTPHNNALQWAQLKQRNGYHLDIEERKLLGIGR